jgi:hypothetical protein
VQKPPQINDNVMIKMKDPTDNSNPGTVFIFNKKIIE